MASVTTLLSEDQFLCSVCLDVFTEPVSIPCGHNFCMSCIAKHWEGKNQCLCPLCNKKFNKGLKLCINTGFREIVENFKKHRVISANHVPVKPGEVPCDVCLGNKFKACKTCLVCLASYCETHLEPHQRVAALRRHKLSDPVPNLENETCKKHNWIMKLFCRDDMTRVCDMCTEHSTHHVVPLEEEYENKRAELEQKKLQIHAMIQERQKKVQWIKDEGETKGKDNNEAVEDIVQVFGTMVTSIQRNMAGLVSAIEEKQRAAERQAGVLLQELEREINQLEKSSSKLEQMSQTEDHLQFIKSFLTFISPHTKSWSDVSIGSQQHYVEDVKKAIVNLEVTLTKEMGRASQQFRLSCKKILDEETDIVKKSPIDLEALPDGIKLDAIRQQYTVDVTFDPYSANDLLLISVDLKQVQTSQVWWFRDQVPHKFNRYAYILGKKGFSQGRFYFEVQAVRKTGWDLGVVRESVRGKKTPTLNPKNGVWIIRLRNNIKFTALNNTTVNLSLTKKPERIGVFVDYEKRLVSFYDVDTATLIYSFTGCLFSEKIYPFFSPGLPENGVNCAPLVLSPAIKDSTMWEKICDSSNLIFTLIVLFLIWIF